MTIYLCGEERRRQPKRSRNMEQIRYQRTSMMLPRRSQQPMRPLHSPHALRRSHRPWSLLVIVSVLLMLLCDMASSKAPSLIPHRRHVLPPTTTPSTSSTSSSATAVQTVNRRIRPTSTSSSSTEAAWISGIKNSLASGLAAGCSKMILAPFDTIKTLQQHSRTLISSSSSSSMTLVQAAQTILQRPKGFLEFYAGIGVAVVGSMPSVGLYFGIYSFCKKTFQQWDPEHYQERQTLYIALSAAIGNTIASASRVPYEVVKQKFQTKVYTNMSDCLADLSLRTLFPTGGIASQMLRDIPYAVITLLTYEHLKTVWKPRAERHFPNVPTRTWDLMVGGLAGGVGSWLTNPMDVLKTRLQTDGDGGGGGLTSNSESLYGGSIMTCAKTTWQEGGPSAFLRGSVPRLLHKVPANAFFFLFYELFRSVLGVQDEATTASTSTSRSNKKKL